MNNIFLKHSIPELKMSLERGDLSFRDLADASIRAINTKEATTKAWVCHDLNNLKAEADKAYENFKTRGHSLPLEGIPFGVKDIFNTSAFPTEMGSSLWKNFTPGNNARVVNSLLHAGAIVVGKTVTAEFAVHSLNETLNPHDQNKTPGTSSSGSAAAVATGMIPFALGTQTAGSIIRPASFCGIWGMKPSFGMIPRTGVLKTSDTLDTIGFLAAHGNSLRSILDVVRVKGPNYPFVYKNVDQRGDFPHLPQKKWRVGFVKTHAWEKAADYTKEAVEDLARKISQEKDFEVETIAWSDEMRASHEIHTTIYNKSLSYYFQNERTAASEVTPIMLRMIEAGEKIQPQTFNKALGQQEDYIEKIDHLFGGFDFVLSLGTSSTAPDRGVEEIQDPSLIWTLSHLPAISAPGFRSPEGMPFGVQFVSKKWNDYNLIQGVEELIKRGILAPGSLDIKASL